MPQPRRPISFIASSDPEAAKTFYTKVIGLKLIEQSPYALAFLDGAAMLRVQIVADFAPAAHTAHGWQVADIDLEIADLTAKGAAFLTFDQLDQSPLGVWTTPDGNKIAWFKDPSGNVLSLTQFAAP